MAEGEQLPILTMVRPGVGRAAQAVGPHALAMVELVCSSLEPAQLAEVEWRVRFARSVLSVRWEDDEGAAP